MTYNLRPRKVSKVLGGASMLNIRGFGQAPHRKNPAPLATHHWPQEELGAHSFACHSAAPVREPLLERVVEGLACKTQPRSKRTRETAAAQSVASSRPPKCGAVMTLPGFVEDAGNFTALPLEKCAPDCTRSRERSSLSAMQQRPAAETLNPPSYLPILPACHTILSPPDLKKKSHSHNSVRKSAACQIQGVAKSSSPCGKIHVHPKAGAPTCRFRRPDPLPQTPARSKSSYQACETEGKQAECSSVNSNATTSRHPGAASTAQLLVFLSPTTSTTPSASRGRKRNREYYRAVGLSFENRGISPQSLSIRTQTTASTLPSPSDLTSPPSNLPLAQPTPGARQAVGVIPSVNVTSRPSSAIRYTGKRAHTTLDKPLDKIADAPQVEPAARLKHNHVEELPLNCSESQETSNIVSDPATISFRRTRSTTTVPDFASVSAPVHSTAAAKTATLVRLNEEAHIQPFDSTPDFQAGRAAKHNGPTRLCIEERRRRKHSPNYRQQEKTALPEKRTAHHKQFGELQCKVGNAADMGCRESSAQFICVCRELPLVANIQSSLPLAGREDLLVNRVVQPQQQDIPAGEPVPAHLATPERSSSFDRSCGPADCANEADGFAREKYVLHAGSPSGKTVHRGRKLRSCHAAVAENCTTYAEKVSDPPESHRLKVLPCPKFSGMRCPTLAAQLERTAASRRSRVTQMPCLSSSLLPANQDNASENPCLLRSLPPLILCSILRFLPLSSLAAFGATCIHARELLRLPSTWRCLDERAAGRWMRQHENLGNRSLICSHSKSKKSEVALTSSTSFHNVRQPGTSDTAEAAEPFACVSKLSVDLTNFRDLSQARSVSQALLSLPAAALLRFAPMHIGRSRIVHAWGSETEGTRRAAPTVAASTALAVRETPSPTDEEGFTAAPPSRSSSFPPYSVLPLGAIACEPSTRGRADGNAPVQRLQSVTEERIVSRRPHTTARGSAAQVDGTLYHILSTQPVAKVSSGEQVGDRLQATGGNQGLPGHRERRDPQFQQHRQRLLRALTALLYSHINLPLTRRGFGTVPQCIDSRTLRTNGEAVALPSLSRVEDCVRALHRTWRQGEHSPAANELQRVPTVQQTPPALNPHQPRGWQNPLVEEEEEENVLPLTNIMPRRSNVNAISSRFLILLQNLCTQLRLPRDSFENWRSQHYDTLRQAHDSRGTTSSSSMQQLMSRHRTSPQSESASRVGQRSPIREQSDFQFRLMRREEQAAPLQRRGSQGVFSSRNEEDSVTEMTEEGAQVDLQMRGAQRSDLREEQHEAIFLHQLLRRLEQRGHPPEGEQLLRTAVVIPSAVGRPAIPSHVVSATEGRPFFANEEGSGRGQCSRVAGAVMDTTTSQQGVVTLQSFQKRRSLVADALASCTAVTGIELPVPGRQARAALAQHQTTGEGRTGTIREPRQMQTEPRGQAVQQSFTCSASLYSATPAHADRAAHSSRNHCQQVATVPRTLLSSGTESVRQQLQHISPALCVTNPTSAIEREASLAVSRGRRSDNALELSSAQCLRAAVRHTQSVSAAPVEGRPIMHAEDRTCSVGYKQSGNPSAAEVASKDERRLVVLRGLLGSMSQLVQINFKLEAREITRYPQLRKELQVVKELLSRNAATLRLIKFSVDLTAIEGVEEIVGRHSDAKETAKRSLRLPLLELPPRLLALQVLHTDYPFIVPPGFSASPSFTQLCIRSLHRFSSPLFSSDVEEMQAAKTSPDSHSNNDRNRPGSHESGRKPDIMPASSSGSFTESELVFHSGEKRKASAYSKPREREASYVHDATCGKEWTNEGGGKYVEACTPNAQPSQDAGEGFAHKSHFSCSSPRKRPRGEKTPKNKSSQRSGGRLELQLGLVSPRGYGSELVEESVSSPAKLTRLSEKQKENRGRTNASSDGEASVEELRLAKDSLRRKHVLRLADLDLSPCHTLTPQSDMGLSLQSSPASDTRETLLDQLREALTPTVANAAPHLAAKSDCDGKPVLLSMNHCRTSSLDPSDDHRLAVCNVAVSPACHAFPMETPAYRYSRAFSFTAESSCDTRERGRHEAPPKTPLAYLQRLLHIGRKTLQQVDLQGDPPRTFCCLHSRLKFYKLRRLSLGWTCTAELVLLHSMLLKGHLPQLRKLQFSGPSGGSGLSIMHLQLYALLNSPPPTCPHHPPVPPPGAVCLHTSASTRFIPLSSSPQSCLTGPEAVGSEHHERACNAYPQEPLGALPYFEPCAAVNSTIHRDGDECCHLNKNFSGFKRERRAEYKTGAAAIRAKHGAQNEVYCATQQLVALNVQVAYDTIDPHGDVESRTSVCEGDCPTSERWQTDNGRLSVPSVPVSPRAPESYTTTGQADSCSLRLLTSLLASAKKTPTFACERCAAMRGGTAHGVYFKYAALDIDFAALIEFRLALQRHGLFAFYKDDRNKLNLLHVEGLTDVTSRDALEEEKSLENRLERKSEAQGHEQSLTVHLARVLHRNTQSGKIFGLLCLMVDPLCRTDEWGTLGVGSVTLHSSGPSACASDEWRRRFAYHHVQSPRSSFSSSSQPSSRNSDSHSRTGASSAELANAALWSIAPLPPNRLPLEQPSVPQSDLGPSQLTTACTNPGTAAETGAHDRGATTFGSRSQRRSREEIDAFVEAVTTRESRSACSPMVPVSNQLMTERVLPDAPPAAAGTGKSRSAITASLCGPRYVAGPLRCVNVMTPGTGRLQADDCQVAQGECQADHPCPAEAATGGLAERRLRPGQIQFSPLDQRTHLQRLQDAELHTRELFSVSESQQVTLSPSRNDGIRSPPPRTGKQGVRSCSSVQQTGTQEGDTKEPPFSPEQRRPRTRSTSAGGSSGRLPCSSRAAAHGAEILQGVGAFDRGGKQTSPSPSFQEIHGGRSNRAGEGSGQPVVVSMQHDLCAGPGRGASCTALSTQSSGATGIGERNDVPCTTMNSHLRPFSPSPNTSESRGTDFPESHAADSVLPQIQGEQGSDAQNQPRRQQLQSLETCVAGLSSAPLSQRGGGAARQQLTTASATTRLPSPDRNPTLYFPEVSPSMSGRDLFFLEMWLAPELCRDLHSASTLCQLYKQLTHLWQHKLTARQRDIYNDVIVKRYVQERQGVQEWNFSTAKAWWMGN